MSEKREVRIKVDMYCDKYRCEVCGMEFLFDDRLPFEKLIEFAKRQAAIPESIFSKCVHWKHWQKVTETSQ